MGGTHSKAFSEEHGICRIYGMLYLASAQNATHNTKFVFHMYSLSKRPRSGDLRLWHVVKAASPRTAIPAEPSKLPLPLQLATRQAGWSPSYIDFASEDGSFQGAIAQGSAGAVFRSRSGDVAEWVRRRGTEAPFDEGDVVGFDENGHLTRSTAGVAQVGIITRIAAVEGSVPSSVDAGSYDTVAYLGHVPVKVVGHCKAGEHLVPSGKHDGTAVAARQSMLGAPRVRLGKALETVPSAEKTYELQPLGDNKAPAWRYVQCTVVPPVESVAYQRSNSWKAALSLLLLVVMCLAGMSYCSHSQSCGTVSALPPWLRPSSPKPCDVGGSCDDIVIPIGGPDQVQLGEMGGVPAAEYVFQKVKLNVGVLQHVKLQRIIDLIPGISPAELLERPCLDDNTARRRLDGQATYNALMLAGCASIGMKPVCNVAGKCGADQKTIFLGHAGHLTNKQLYTISSWLHVFPESLPPGFNATKMFRDLLHLTYADDHNHSICFYEPHDWVLKNDSSSCASSVWPSAGHANFPHIDNYTGMARCMARCMDRGPGEWHSPDSDNSAFFCARRVGAPVQAPESTSRHFVGSSRLRVEVARKPAAGTACKAHCLQDNRDYTPANLTSGAKCTSAALGKKQYELKFVRPRIDRSYAGTTSASIVAACKSIGMKPVCNDWSSCGDDPQSIFLGQDGTLSAPPTLCRNAEFPFASAGAGATLCFKTELAAVKAQVASSCGAWCSTDPEYVGKTEGICGGFEHTRCTHSRAGTGLAAYSRPDLCGMRNGRSCSLTFLRIFLESAPGGVCYYTGLNSAADKTQTKCGNNTCYSSFRRPGSLHTADCETGGGQATGQIAALCKAPWSQELLWMAPSLLHTSPEPPHAKGARQDQQADHLRVVRPAAWSPSWSFLCARELNASSHSMPKV